VNEALILGGGLAGGAAAILLARSGIPAHVLERTQAPHHKLCGEFLSIEAQHELKHLGVDLDRLGALPIDRLRLARGKHSVEARLPFLAYGISRKILDEAVLEVARSAGAIVERGVKVNRLRGLQADTSAGMCEARHVFLATGKHEVRDARRRSAVPRHDYIGVKMHWRLDRRGSRELGEAIELVLFEGGYAGLQRIAPDIANLCLIVRRDRFTALGGRWEDMLLSLMREPHVQRRLGDAEALFSRPLTIADVPYGHVHAHASTLDGVFRLGDQAAVTAPLSGDGMASALRSARMAADCLRTGGDAAHYHKRLEKLTAGQIRRAMLLQRATNSPLAIRAGFGLLRLWPGLLSSLASATRLPDWKHA